MYSTVCGSRPPVNGLARLWLPCRFRQAHWRARLTAEDPDPDQNPRPPLGIYLCEQYWCHAPQMHLSKLVAKSRFISMRRRHHLWVPGFWTSVSRAADSGVAGDPAKPVNQGARLIEKYQNPILGPPLALVFREQGVNRPIPRLPDRKFQTILEERRFQGTMSRLPVIGCTSKKNPKYVCHDTQRLPGCRGWQQKASGPSIANRACMLCLIGHARAIDPKFCN